MIANVIAALALAHLDRCAEGRCYDRGFGGAEFAGEYPGEGVAEDALYAAALYDPEVAEAIFGQGGEFVDAFEYARSAS